MNDLEKCRNEIDEIDTLIISLYERRMDIIKEVINYKIENNLPVLDTSRENLMLIKNLEKIKNEEYKKYYKDILNGFLNASRNMQKDIFDLEK